MDLRNFFPQMESACGECDNEEDIVQTFPSSDFQTTNSQALGGSVCLKLSQQTRGKARLSYQKKWEQKYPCNNSKLGMLLLLCYYCGVWGEKYSSFEMGYPRSSLPCMKPRSY